MQAIEVKFLSVTNNRPDRLKAFCSAGYAVKSIHELYDMCGKHDFDSQSKCLAEYLRDNLGWSEDIYGQMVMGTLKNGNNVFVFTKGK